MPSRAPGDTVRVARSAGWRRSRRLGASARHEDGSRLLLVPPAAHRGVSLGGARQRVSSTQKNLAVASVEQLFEVVAPIETHRLAIRLESLEGGARQPVEGGVVLYDAAEDVGHRLALEFRFALDRVGSLQPDPDLVDPHIFSWSSGHFAILTRICKIV